MTKDHTVTIGTARRMARTFLAEYNMEIICGIPHGIKLVTRHSEIKNHHVFVPGMLTYSVPNSAKLSYAEENPILYRTPTSRTTIPSNMTPPCRKLA
jgi:hypothetical protein